MPSQERKYDFKAVVDSGFLGFTSDLLYGKKELAARFGWSGLTLTQTARLLYVYAFSQDKKDVNSWRDEIKKGLKSAYPRLAASFFTANTEIPASFFLENFSAQLGTTEARCVEEGIKHFKLTPTEYTIILLVARGKKYREISLSLDMAYNTLRESHNVKIFEKMQVLDRTQLAIKAYTEGLVPNLNPLG